MSLVNKREELLGRQHLSKVQRLLNALTSALKEVLPEDVGMDIRVTFYPRKGQISFLINDAPSAQERKQPGRKLSKTQREGEINGMVPDDPFLTEEDWIRLLQDERIGESEKRLVKMFYEGGNEPLSSEQIIRIHPDVSCVSGPSGGHVISYGGYNSVFRTKKIDIRLLPTPETKGEPDRTFRMYKMHPVS